MHAVSIQYSVADPKIFSARWSYAWSLNIKQHNEF